MKQPEKTLDNKPSLKFRYAALILLLIVLFFTSFLIGRYPLSPVDVAETLWSGMTKALHSVFPHISVHEVPTRHWTLVFQLRIPRILAAMVIGTALSLSGASYQAVFKNPMVSPDILGASSGAAFGAAFGIILGTGYVTISILSFSFGLISVAIAIGVSLYFRHDRTLGLVLAGIMVSSVFSAMLSFLKLVADTDNELPAITYWLMGSLANIDLSSLFIALIPISIGLLPIIVLRWRINAFTMGEEEARSLGINVHLMRLVVIFAATLMTSASICISGMIGFIGLVIPHFARLFMGQNYKHVVWGTILIGSCYLLIVDNISRGLYTTEIPLGILTSFIGAPVFILLMMKRQKH